MPFSPADPIDIGSENSMDVDLLRVEEPVRIGRYRLCYELGSGGMASVYLARAEGPGGFAKAVAIKRIHPHLARRKDLIEMFLDEARLASLISHPNVCSTFDFGDVDGTYFLAMEYLVGEPLSLVERRVVRAPDLLASTRWQRCFAKIIADAAEGLHAAHELKDERGRSLNVVHRDVSPQNLFVTYDGVAKVVDFGVAFATDRITRTVTGGIKGKLGYLAPEQLARAPYDRRLDVWALGIVLWEGLTGQRLFMSRSEVDTLLAVQHREIPPPSRIVPTVSPALDAVVLRALQRDPEQRYPTARALSRDLVGYLAQSGDPLTNVEVGELLSEICGDRRDVRAEVVASVLEQPAAPATYTVQPPRRGVRAPSPIEPPRSSPPPPTETDAFAMHDAATEVRVIEAPAPSAELAMPMQLAAPLPLPAPHPMATTQPGESRTTGRLVALVGFTVLALSAVAIAAIVTVGMRDDRTGPPAAPTVASVSPVALATRVPVTGSDVPPPPPPPIAEPTIVGDVGSAPTDPPPPEPHGLESTPVRVPPRPAPIQPPGTLSVQGRPVSMTVCIRARCAQTPTRFEDVAPGNVTLRVTAPDGRSWVQRVRVAPGADTRVVVQPP